MRNLIYFLLAVLLVVLVALLLGCAPAPTKPAAPPEKVITVNVATYVPVPADLTKRCSWTKSAPLDNVIIVAHGRRTCLEQYERQFDAIDALQGKAAP